MYVNWNTRMNINKDKENIMYKKGSEENGNDEKNLYICCSDDVEWMK